MNLRAKVDALYLVDLLHSLPDEQLQASVVHPNIPWGDIPVDTRQRVVNGMLEHRALERRKQEEEERRRRSPKVQCDRRRAAYFRRRYGIGIKL